MKPAEIDIRSLAPKVRTALEAVSVLAPNEHTLRSVELMAALAQLQAIATVGMPIHATVYATAPALRSIGLSGIGQTRSDAA